MHRAILAGVFGLLAAAAAQAGAVEFGDTSKDFGVTPRGPVLRHYFTVKNTSNEPITLGQPRVSWR